MPAERDTHRTYDRPGVTWWRAAQGLVLAITLGLIGLLYLRPASGLNLLWNVLIPIVPASLLVGPGWWRNVCPLATLNMFTQGALARRPLGARLGAIAAVVGIGLLVVLVPARRFVFNTNGPALALTIGAVAVLALTLGLWFDMKGGFCNALCPVLPVERLYGQHPLWQPTNPRCPTCTVCTKRGCIDLGPNKAVAQVLGSRRRSAAWLATGFGIFAASFPGFVLGYYTATDGGWSTAGSVYLWVAGWMAASYGATAVGVSVLRLDFRVALTLLAAGAAVLYYWYAAPLVSDGVGAGTLATWPIRLAAGSLIALWLWCAVGRIREPAAGAPA